MNESTKIIIDTDVSIGIPDRDVDDGLALVMAKNSPQLCISAVTLTYGNSTLANVQESMNRLNDYLGIPGICIASGAATSFELGKKTDAIVKMATLLEQSKHTLVCLGPLTNVASLLQLRPDLKTQIDRIIVVAGRRPGHRFLTGNYPLSHPDLNFEKDPVAAQIILDAGNPIIFAPFEISSKVWITDNFLQKLSEAKTHTSDFLRKNCQPWLELWKEKFSTALLPNIGFNPFDCLAIAILTDTDLITSEKCDAKIDASNYDATDLAVQGTGSGNKQYLHVSHNEQGLHTYCFDIVREEFLIRLLNRLT